MRRSAMENMQTVQVTTTENKPRVSAFRYGFDAVLAFFGFSTKTHRASKKRAKLVGDIATYIILLFGAFLMLYPFWWMIAASFAATAVNGGKAYVTTLIWWPTLAYPTTINGVREGLFHNYEIIFSTGFTQGFPTGYSYWRAVGNNLFYSIVPVVVGVITSAMAAFSFAKINWIGRNAMFLFLLAAIMVPGPSIMAMQYAMYDSFGFLDNWAVMVVPGLFGSIMTAFFIRQFLFGMPTSIIEAAKIDGAGYGRIFISFILPLAMPAIVAQGLLSFMGAWNNYMGSYIFINSGSVWMNLPHAMSRMEANNDSFVNDQGPILAAAVLCVLPVIILFAIFQKMIIGSLMLTGSKE